MKGFETENLLAVGDEQAAGKKDCPAMKGFETRDANNKKSTISCKRDCPAMKGFETLIVVVARDTAQPVRRIAPL